MPTSQLHKHQVNIVLMMMLCNLKLLLTSGHPVVMRPPVAGLCAVATNNPSLMALLTQARELIQQDCRKAIDRRRQITIDVFVLRK